MAQISPYSTPITRSKGAKWHWILLLLCCTSSFAEAQNLDLEKTAQIKAAYLFNLLKFIQQSVKETSSSEIVFCFAGDENMIVKHAKEAFFKHTVKEKNIIVQHLASFPEEISEAEISACQMIYFNLPPVQTASIQTLINSKHIISTSDQEGFAQGGGMVELSTNKNKNKVSIIINKKTCEDAAVTVNSKLLQLAEIINQ